MSDTKVLRSLVNKDEKVAVRAFEIQKITQWLKDRALPALAAQFPEQAGALTDSMSEIALTFAVVCEEINNADDLIGKMGIIGSAVEDVCAEVEKVSSVIEGGIPGTLKKDIVMLLITESYDLVDKGWDGKQNRIQLTRFLPTGVSDTLERMILSIGAGIAVNAAVKAWQRFGGK